MVTELPLKVSHPSGSDMRFENTSSLPNMHSTCKLYAVEYDNGESGIITKLGLRKIPKRVYVTMLLFLNQVMVGFQSATPIIVVADLTSDKTIVRGNETEIVSAECNNWTSEQKSFVLASNSIGNTLVFLMAGIVHKVGGATFLAIGASGQAILSILCPFILTTHLNLFATDMMMSGFFEGLCFIGLVDVLVHWAPENERVRLLTFALVGYGVGGSSNYPLSGYVIQHFGWKNLFFVSGAISLVLTLVWSVSVTNDPSTDTFITEKEKKYLSEEINYISKEMLEIPYKEIFTSIPVYAMLNTFFTSAFTLSLMTLLPFYVKDVHNMDIQDVGLISGIPELSALITRPLFAYFIDYLRSANYSINILHKWFLFVSLSLTVVFIVISVILSNIIECIVCLAIARITFSIMHASFTSITIDMAGQYAGFLQAVAVAVINLGYFVNPLLMGFFIRKHSEEEWDIYFLVICFITVYCMIVFLFFGSGELQSWARSTPSPAKEIDQTKPVDSGKA